jgi:hypothetical protein
MFIHMFSFRWKQGVTEQQKQHVFNEVSALKDQIPGILDSAAGFNTSPRGQGYEFGGVMKFYDRAAYEAYNAHPVHQQLLTWLLPLIDPMELDFEL